MTEDDHQTTTTFQLYVYQAYMKPSRPRDRRVKGSGPPEGAQGCGGQGLHWYCVSHSGNLTLASCN